MDRLSAPGAAAIRACGKLLAPGGGRGTLLVLIFHRVLPEPDPLLPGEPDVVAFAAQADLIAAICRVLPLQEAVDRLYSGSLPERAACITFDDGYANNLTQAAPILKSRGLPATVFVATSFLNGGRMWNDQVIESVRHARGELDLTSLGLGRHGLEDVPARRRAIDALIGALKYSDPHERAAQAAAIAERVGSDGNDLMLTEEQVRQLRREGVDIGAHTVTHPILVAAAADDARREIAASKSILESMIGEPVTLFAYPNGRPRRDYAREHVEMVRQAGFSAAVSTAWGACRRASDRFQLPRMLPWDTSALKFAARLLRTHRAAPAESV